MSRLLKLAGKKINENRESKLQKFTFEGDTFDCSDRSLLQIQTYIVALSCGYQLPANFTWRSDSNVDVPMTETKLRELFVTAVNHRSTVYNDSFTLKGVLKDKSFDEVLDLVGVK